ncbi:Cerato-platanin [Dactylellina cionopaga]|nr:Cerato-platanin [Dactylellina cionopaga]
MVNFIAYVLPFIAAVAATDFKYDNNYSYSSNLALTSFACSDGPNGLITKTGARTVGELRARLQQNVWIAGSPFVSGWGSPKCGECYQARNPKNNKSFKFVVIDHATPATVVGEDAFKSIGNTGSLFEGHYTVYLSGPLPRNQCFK